MIGFGTWNTYEHDGKTWETPVGIHGVSWRYIMVYTILSFNICPEQMAIGSVPHFQTTVWSWGDVDGGNVSKLAMKYLLYDVAGCSV